jgi:hypothetical protein
METKDFSRIGVNILLEIEAGEAYIPIEFQLKNHKMPHKSRFQYHLIDEESPNKADFLWVEAASNDIDSINRRDDDAVSFMGQIRQFNKEEEIFFLIIPISRK